MADKDFKVKNKLVLNGLAQAGILLADANKQVDSVTYLTPLQGGTGTTQAPAAGQVLYSTSGTTYAPVTLSTLVPQEVYYQADAPSSPATGAIWVESDSNIASFQLPTQTGNSGKYLTTDGNNTSWASVSSPTTWTTRKTQNATSINGFAYNGSNLYVAYGNSGSLFTSTDGKSWTSRTSGFGSNNINKISYGNGIWVAVGASGTITTSTDGINWTARTSNLGTNAINYVEYGRGYWVAVGAGGTGTGASGSNTGGLAYSTDAITWTKASLPNNTPSTYYSVSMSTTKIVATGYLPAGATFTVNGISSTDGTTWNAATLGSNIFPGGNPTPGGIDCIIWNGSNFIVRSGSPLASHWARVSDDLSSYAIFDYSSTPMSVANMGTVNHHRGNSYYNGYMYNQMIGGIYNQSWSTTMDSTNNYPSQVSTLQFSPGAVISGNSTSSALSCIYAGAVGILLGTSSGAIYSSF